MCVHTCEIMWIHFCKLLLEIVLRIFVICQLCTSMNTVNPSKYTLRIKKIRKTSIIRTKVPSITEKENLYITDKKSLVCYREI